jgi:hypothetical protein
VTTTVDISTLQGIRDLLVLLEMDAEVILTEMSVPIAKLVGMNQPQIPQRGRVPDMHPDVWVSDDFDDPMPEEYWKNRTL